MLPYVYVDAVRRSGARAILLPPGGDDDEASATVASLDGLVVSGGPDIEPVRYGAARHPRTQVPVAARDAWDLSVTSHALRQGGHGKPAIRSHHVHRVDSSVPVRSNVGGPITAPYVQPSPSGAADDDCGNALCQRHLCRRAG